MSVLKSKTRNALPDDAFAIPSERKYPIHDLAHARNALSRVSANGTPEEKSKVHSAVFSRWSKYLHDESKAAIQKHMSNKRNDFMKKPEDKQGKVKHDNHSAKETMHDKSGICPTCGASKVEEQKEGE